MRHWICASVKSLSSYDEALLKSNQTASVCPPIKLTKFQEQKAESCKHEQHMSNAYLSLKTQQVPKYSFSVITFYSLDVNSILISVTSVKSRQTSRDEVDKVNNFKCMGLWVSRLIPKRHSDSFTSQSNTTCWFLRSLCLLAIRFILRVNHIRWVSSLHFTAFCHRLTIYFYGVLLVSHISLWCRDAFIVTLL